MFSDFLLGQRQPYWDRWYQQGIITSAYFP
jgi:hypothetical protein